MAHRILRLTRRSFLRLAALIAAPPLWGSWAAEAEALAGAGKFRRVRDERKPSPLEREHLPVIQLPREAEDGADVPIIIDIPHEQRPGDYIRTVEIFNFNDPIISKGKYHFTPATGRVHLTLHMRMDQGRSRVYVAVECSRHGKWVTHKNIQVAKGGC